MNPNKPPRAAKPEKEERPKFVMHKDSRPHPFTGGPKPPKAPTKKELQALSNDEQQKRLAEHHAALSAYREQQARRRKADQGGILSASYQANLADIYGIDPSKPTIRPEVARRTRAMGILAKRKKIPSPTSETQHTETVVEPVLEVANKPIHTEDPNLTPDGVDVPNPNAEAVAAPAAPEAKFREVERTVVVQEFIDALEKFKAALPELNKRLRASQSETEYTRKLVDAFLPLRTPFKYYLSLDTDGDTKPAEAIVDRELMSLYELMTQAPMFLSTFIEYLKINKKEIEEAVTEEERTAAVARVTPVVAIPVVQERSQVPAIENRIAQKVAQLKRAKRSLWWTRVRGFLGAVAALGGALVAGVVAKNTLEDHIRHPRPQHPVVRRTNNPEELAAQGLESIPKPDLSRMLHVVIGGDETLQPNNGEGGVPAPFSSGPPQDESGQPIHEANNAP